MMRQPAERRQDRGQAVLVAALRGRDAVGQGLAAAAAVGQRAGALAHGQHQREGEQVHEERPAAAVR